VSGAALDPHADRWAWQAWTFRWDARPGRHTVCARATDASGRTQPLEQPWNLGGFANNLIHRVPVVVLDA